MIAAALGAATGDSEQHRNVVFQLRVDEVAIVAGLLIALAIVATVIARRERPPHPGPRTLETPPQSPSVAGLLVHTREVSGEAAAATLVDLAARGIFEIVDMGDETGVRRTHKTATELTPYEQRVVKLVEDCADAEGVAPAGALTLPDDQAARSWFMGFRDEVIGEARRDGWVRRRYGREVVGLGGLTLGLGVVIAIWGYATATKYDPDPPHVVPHEGLRNALAFVAIGIGVLDLLALGALGNSTAQRLTRSGRPLAAAWLGVAEHLRADEQLASAPPAAVAIWHRLLAYAAAFGAAHSVQEALPLGVESATRAWSTESGRWRMVRVRYPKWWPSGWGFRPGELFKRGLLLLMQAGFPVAVILSVGTRLFTTGAIDSLHVPWWAYAIGVAVVVPLLAIAVYAVLLLLVSVGTLAALFGRQRQVEGRAVRVRPIEDSGEHWVALDNGTRDEVLAYQVRIPNSVVQGDHVRLTVRPVTGEVLSVVVLDHRGAQSGASPEAAAT